MSNNAKIMHWMDTKATGDQLYIISLLFCPEIARRSHPSEMDQMSMGTQALIDHIISKVPEDDLVKVINFLTENNYRSTEAWRKTS